MKEGSLDYFICPKKRRAKTCSGKLALKEVFGSFKSNPEEIKEGYLMCSGCGSCFPIFFGIPILISDLAGYLRDNLPLILELSKKHDQIHGALVADSLLLINKAKQKENKELFDQTRKQIKERNAKTIKELFKNPYLLEHYGDYRALARPEEPLHAFLRTYKRQNPHAVLGKFLKLYSNDKKSTALEIGCNAGGFLRELSKKAKLVFGLDNSFEQLFFTSCLLKCLPRKIDQYQVVMEAGIKVKQRIRIEPIDNLTLVAGDGANLPFGDSSLSVVLSCNVIDIIDDPLGLLKEKIRVLRSKGLVLSSDPYQFLGRNKEKLGIMKGQTPWQRIKKVLGSRIKILGERDNVPWIMRPYRRHYNIYYNHCFCGEKRS